jgi:hypothetical protein
MFKSIARMGVSFSTIIKEACRDNATGKYSHSRIIAMLVAFGATVFMWKIAFMGSMSVEMFALYLAYGTGYQTVNKLLDNKDDARMTQARALNKDEPQKSSKD